MLNSATGTNAGRSRSQTSSPAVLRGLLGRGVGASSGLTRGTPMWASVIRPFLTDDRRTVRRGWMVSRRRSRSGSSSRSRSSCAAARPRSCAPRLTLVSPGVVTSASSVSSIPTTATSCGIRRSRSAMTCMVAIASRSLPPSTASGTVRSSRDCAALRPSASVKSPASTRSDSSGSSPSARAVRSNALPRAEPGTVSLGPLTKAIRRQPCACRCSSAMRTPPAELARTLSMGTSAGTVPMTTVGRATWRSASTRASSTRTGLRTSPSEYPCPRLSSRASMSSVRPPVDETRRR